MRSSRLALPACVSFAASSARVISPNVVGLQSMLPRWGAVVATSTSHIHTDEGGAPERVAGIKILSIPTEDGKLTPAAVERRLEWLGDQHHPQPGVVSISQVTELGTVYTPAEIAFCRGRVPELAVRFAAKEAVSKALGTGIMGIGWREIEILPDRARRRVTQLIQP